MNTENDMSETAVNDLPPAKPKEPQKPKQRRGPQRRRMAPAVPKPVEFAGLGNRQGECCDACEGGVCYITKQGSGFCAHPRMAGLQSADMNRPAVADRYRRAKKYLDQMALDRR
jgi:hypothetical protein